MNGKPRVSLAAFLICQLANPVLYYPLVSTSLKGNCSMDTKYVVFSGPHYPPAVQIESSTDYCLVAQAGCTMQVLLAYTAPVRYKSNLRTRKKNEGKAILERHAKTLNGKKTSIEAKEKLLKDLAEVRAVQVNVAHALIAAQRKAQRPAKKFGVIDNCLGTV